MMRNRPGRSGFNWTLCIRALGEVIEEGGSGKEVVEAWRSALAEELFGEAAGAPLYLFLEPARFSRIAEKMGVGEGARSALANTIKAKLRWQGDLWRTWQDETSAWERGGKIGPPPFLDLLVLLTLGAESMVADEEHAAHNYYARLSDLLGLDATQSDRVRRYFPETVGYWQALNDWLEEWEGERGWPTARVYDRRKYIGYPLSQALVREQDRRSLHAAFDRYNLQPMRRMGAAEMVEILSDWVGRGLAPGNLIRLWNDHSIRRRVAEIACAELSHWRGPLERGAAGPRDTGPRAQRLEWLAELTTSPVAKLEFYLIARSAPEEAAGNYTIRVERTDEAGRVATQACADNLRLEVLNGMRWASLEPWSQIGVTSLFAGALELVNKDDPERLYLRSPAPILVLEQDADRGQYLEVPRIQLFKPSLVLAHASNEVLIERHLGAYARDGWTKFTPGNLINLPAGWLAFVDVMMIKPCEDNTISKLEPMCAGAATIVDLAGGIQLGHGVWHAARPPEVLASVEGGAGFRLSMAPRNSESAATYLGQFVGRAVVDLGPYNPSIGDHEILLQQRLSTDVTRTLDSIGLRLRTGDAPKPIGVRDTRDERYDLTSGFGIYSTTAAFAAQSANMRGCWIEHDAPMGEAPNLRAPEPQLHVRQTRNEEFTRRSARVDDERFAQSCAVRAHHVWLCEEGRPGDDFRTLKYQRCETCHREEWTRNRGVRRRGGPRPRMQQPRRVRELSDVPRYRRLLEAEAGGFDLLLDALTYLASGSQDRFRALAREISPDEGFAWNASRVLFGLGHVDIEVDEKNGRARSWRVAPSGLVETTDGAWVLAGARSASLMASLRTWAESRSIPFEHAAMEAGPSLVRLKADYAALVDAPSILSPYGHPLYLAPNFSRRLSWQLPKLSSALGFMPAFKVGSEPVDHFDLEAGGWSETEHDKLGAYRVEFRGLNYGFTGPDDLAGHIMRVGDVSLVKHLAASAAGVSLLHYESDQQALFAPLGAALPGLAERAAVMCSGKAPRYRSDAGLIEYEDVPRDVAIVLQNHLHA